MISEQTHDMDYKQEFQNVRMLWTKVRQEKDKEKTQNVASTLCIATTYLNNPSEHILRNYD